MGPAASDAQRQQLTPCDFPVPSWPVRDGALHFNHHRVPTEREGEHFPWHLTEIKFHLTLKDLKKNHTPHTFGSFLLFIANFW